MIKVYHDWWQTEKGWIRLSAQNVGTEKEPIWIPRYVAWQHHGPVLYWFDSLEEARKAIE